MPSLIFDFETRSPVDLLDRGMYVYAEHPMTDALLASFKMSAPNDLWTGPEGVCRWRRGEPCPPYLRAYVEAGGEICAHNAAFERIIWWNVMVPKHGWPKPKLEQFRCTAATAAAMALPRSLDRLGDALGLKIKKDKAGSGLIKIHSVPLGFDSEGQPVWHPLADDPASLEAFHQYCDIDVLSEEEAHHRLIPLSDAEMEVYWLNERINDRGLRIDVRSAHAALELAEEAKAKINRELYDITGGAVPAVTLTGRMKEWVHAQGVPIAAMDKDEIDETLATELPDNVRRALELRIEGGKSSVEKIAGMLRSTTKDGTIKGVFLHHGAGQSGRFSSRGAVQVHNMPRPRKIFEDAHVRRDVLFDAIRTGDPDVLNLMYGDVLGRPLHLLADSLRSFIWAAPGHRFIGGDFSSIEGRVTAWYGRDQWKLKAYRDLDAGIGQGIYETTAAGIYGVPVEKVTKSQRQVGKVAELACVAEGTMVLTHNGAKVIEEVTINDLLWDGVEWVNHQGLVDRGIRETINVCGIEATPDHLFLAGTKWLRANHIASRKSFRTQTLATGSASLPCWAWSELEKVCANKTSSASNVIAERLHTLLPTTTYETVKALVAMFVQKSLRGTGEKIIGGMQKYAVMMRTGVDCWGVYRPASTGATTQTTQGILIMVGAASPYMKSSAPTVRRFCNTLLGLKVGTSRVLNWIESTSTKAISRVICGSYLKKKTTSTNGRSKTCSVGSPSLKRVYDIAHAGPLNRFTIVSSSGFLISHNCGFGGGAGALARMARANRLDLSAVYPTLWEITDDEGQEKAERRYEENLKRGDTTAQSLTREAYIAAELIKTAWRTKHPGTVQAWRSLIDAAFTATQNPGEPAAAIGLPFARYIVAHGFLWLQLPSGRCLAYGMPEIRPVEVPWADKNQEPSKREKQPAVTVRGVGANSAWTRYPLNISICYNNLVQATARDLLVHAMHNVERHGYPVRMHVHDEIVSEVPNTFGSVEHYEKLMCQAPEWSQGLPLAAAGFTLKRYAKT